MSNGPVDDKGSRPSNARWWEQYTVRYFVCTVVEAAILFVLRDKATLHCEIARIIPSFAAVDAKQASAVVAMGLAYCYIASAPVLTLQR
jgi:hypothetical protein